MPDYYSDLYNPSNGYGVNPQQQPPDQADDANPWINNFATKGVLTGLGYLGETLGKPQQALYGLASGLMKGDIGEGLKSLANLIPLSDTLGITNSKPGEGWLGGIINPLTEHRLEGRDLLRQAGLADGENTWGNFGAGLALDIVSDPLAWIRGPAGALTKLGEHASKGIAGVAPLERTLAGRIRGAATTTAGYGGSITKYEPQGGWAAIADRPWYAEMIPGIGRQKNIAVLGTGKYGQAAAEGLDKGWSAATRATIPGTDFSPVAWLRSSFEKGAGNVSGYAPIVDEFGKTVAPRTEALSSAAREAVLPQGQAQADALNELQRLGMSQDEAAKALNRGSVSRNELGQAYMPTNATPQQSQVISKFADDYSTAARKYTSDQAAAAKAVGKEIDHSYSIWGHEGYSPRTMADTGDKVGTQYLPRKEMFNKVPGGTQQIERFMTDPEISGIANRKVAGAAYDGQAIEAAIQKKADEFYDEILREGGLQQSRLGSKGVKLSDEAEKILTDEPTGRALARELAEYSSKLEPKVAERGYFYRQDPYLGLSNYGVGLASIRAVREGALDVLAKEGKDIGQMLTKTNNVANVISLKEAIDQLGMKGAEQELLKRTGLSSIDDLASRGVDKKLIDNLGKELAGPKPPGSVSQALSKMTSAFRYGVTVPWPANFVRNWSGELVNQGVSGSSPIKNLGNATSYLNRTLTDPAKLAKAQSAYEAGVTHGVLAQSNVHELLGTGVTGAGDIAFNIAKPQVPRTLKEIGRDFAEPITSEAKRTAMGMTPLRELMGYGQQIKQAAKAPASNSVINEVAAAAKEAKPAAKVLPSIGDKAGSSGQTTIKINGMEQTMYHPPINRPIQTMEEIARDTARSNFASNFMPGVSEDEWYNLILKKLKDGLETPVAETAVEHSSKFNAYYDTFYGKINSGASKEEARAAGDAAVKNLKSAGEISHSVVDNTVASEVAQPTASNSTLKAIAESAPPPTSKPGLLEKAATYAGKVIDPVRGYAAAMETGHAFQNEATRLQQIMNLMEEGYSAEAAAKRVKVTQRDYSNLTSFEQGTARNVVPFFNFSKQNLISQADMISRDPGRYNAMLSVVNSGRSDDSFVPAWASSGTAIPLPGAPEGSQRFLGSLGLPAEDETIGALAALVSGHPIESIRRMASSSNPVMKTPYEMATGRQIFSGRNLEDLRPSPVISGLLGDNQFSRGLTESLTGTPLSRVFSTADRAFSTERNGVLATLLNLGTGIRSVDVNQEQAASIAARNAIERLMRESGNFKSREQVYLKPELKGQEAELPPEIQALMQMHKILDQKAQAAAKAKAGQR